MKKLFVPGAIVLALCILIVACRKEHTTPRVVTAQSKVPVHIGVTGFTQKVDNNVQARQDVGGNVNHLYYLAYDDNTQHVASYRITSAADPNFGEVFDTLYPGRYNVILIASPENLLGEINIGQMYDFNYANSGLHFPGLDSLPLPSLFYKKLVVDVTTTGRVTIDTVTLERLNGSLEVRILDAVNYDPMITTTVTVDAESAGYYFAYDYPSFASSDSIIKKLRRLPTGYFGDFMLNTARAFTINIEQTNLYTAQTTVKQIHNVRCERNKRTIVEGRLNNGNFVVRVNDAWNGEIFVPFKQK
ncbi:fimbrillin-A associated anchor protein Mfa1/Mfa2 [Chitinophaga skermanii]|uniref:Fimbrillin-A associated anchor protein Mfa1/Mfa2 n=1 Tax=Chitinophaga skermanii TaxID=331697 RepID=A0A327QVV1_9BACT|nr:FimB/Mfa2 family fimbrial subunit [Chitinophaga skermanii]RAJ08719.1 fimbrillin-A associated anchor protein Mfa1/Mfa2 [Chitinophaga skermanii]